MKNKINCIDILWMFRSAYRNQIMSKTQVNKGFKLIEDG